MKKISVYIAICIAVISSNILNAQEHPFHQPNWGKSVVTKYGRSNISSLELLPVKPMSKSNDVMQLKTTVASQEAQQNSIPEPPLSKMNFPKSFGSAISSSSNNRNELPQKPASKRTI